MVIKLFLNSKVSGRLGLNIDFRGGFLLVGTKDLLGGIESDSKLFTIRTKKNYCT